jgi:hypothetical protein
MNRELIVCFQLSALEFEALKILAGGTLPDSYAQGVIRNHLFVEAAKARRRLRKKKLKGLYYDKLNIIAGEGAR